jgi:N-acetyl-alpha-D-muramate 1-phosphate uridylyltransferase
MLPVAILAGGLATRLLPVTEHLPKSLVPVAGRPFIFHQLDLLRRQGIRRVVLCLGHLGAQIQAALRSGVAAGLEISYSFDGAQPLGTGGALRCALPLLGEHFFVLYGDSYLPCPLVAVESAYRSAHRPALMTVLRNQGRWGTSNVLLKAGQLLAYDKRVPRPGMEHIDFGLSVLARGVLAHYAEGAVLDLADVLQQLSLDGELAAFEVGERFYEIGSREGLRDAEEFLAGGRRAASRA